MEREAKEGSINFDKVKVKRVRDYFERADVESMLSRYHPLGANKAQGRRMSYVASYKGEWIAALVFDSAVKWNKHREKRIGWDSAQRDERRIHVANNSRFLIMPRFQGIKNLASKILSMVTERISGDCFPNWCTPPP